MKWYFYEMSPIDQLWEMLSTPEETAKKLIDSSDNGPEGGISCRAVLFIKDYNNALDEFKKKGWEGDFRGESTRVFWLPEDIDFVYAFVWKQDNNGSTFVVSPRELIWLKEYEST
jgi:hypothetical protein